MAYINNFGNRNIITVRSVVNNFYGISSIAPVCVSSDSDWTTQTTSAIPHTVRSLGTESDYHSVL